MGKTREDRERETRKEGERKGDGYIQSRSNVMLSYDRGGSWGKEGNGWEGGEGGEVVKEEGSEEGRWRRKEVEEKGGGGGSGRKNMGRGICVVVCGEEGDGGGK